MVVVALAAPLRVTVTPPPFAAGVIVPLILRVGADSVALLCALETPAHPRFARQATQRIARIRFAQETLCFT